MGFVSTARRCYSPDATSRSRLDDAPLNRQLFPYERETRYSGTYQPSPPKSALATRGRSPTPRSFSYKERCHNPSCNCIGNAVHARDIYSDELPIPGPQEREKRAANVPSSDPRHLCRSPYISPAYPLSSNLPHRSLQANAPSRASFSPTPRSPPPTIDHSHHNPSASPRAPPTPSPPPRLRSPLTISVQDARDAIIAAPRRMFSPPPATSIEPEFGRDILPAENNPAPSNAIGYPLAVSFQRDSEVRDDHRRTDRAGSLANLRGKGRWSRSASPGAKHVHFSATPAVGGEQAQSDGSSVFRPRRGIPKPPGQVTRINRGGYSLFDALGWKEDEYKDVQNFLHNLAKRYLMPESSYSKQDSQEIERLCAKACSLRPQLQGYQDDWHIKDFLRIYLQNSSREDRINPSARL